MKFSKNYRKVAELVDANKAYSIEEACELVKKTSTVKFDATVDVSLHLNVPYEPELFLEKTKGYESCPERGERCSICFDLRLRKTAEEALALGYDFFATTLTLSPLKNADVINAIGEKISKEVGVKYLPTDFKKKNGYKTSIELSKEFDLYRQNYCGCIFSKN